jgi:DNA-binding CsgD family transcriptional regulator
LPLATLRAGVALWQRQLDVASAAIDSGLRQLGDSDDVWFAAPLIWHAMRVEAERAEVARATFNENAVTQAEARGELFRRLSQKMCASGRQQGALRLVVDAYDVMCEGEFLRIRGEAAPDVWSVVASSWDQLGQPYPATYARYRWSEALLARPNGTAKAGQQLRLAFASAMQMGAEPMRQDIADLAARARIDLTGEPEPERSIVTVDLRESAIAQLVIDAGLTKREAQILELVADGQSNRGIAEVCFISEKTASVHVSNILMKLGVHSRVQAAAVLHRAVASKA